MFILLGRCLRRRLSCLPRMKLHSLQTVPDKRRVFCALMPCLFDFDPDPNSDPSCGPSCNQVTSSGLLPLQMRAKKSMQPIKKCPARSRGNSPLRRSEDGSSREEDSASIFSKQTSCQVSGSLNFMRIVLSIFEYVGRERCCAWFTTVRSSGSWCLICTNGVRSWAKANFRVGFLADRVLADRILAHRICNPALRLVRQPESGRTNATPTNSSRLAAIGQGSGDLP